MKKIFTLSKLSFYFLMFIVFFFIGMYIAGFIGVGKNQMLAGGAIVFGWGILFAILALIFSFFVVHIVQETSIVRFNWLLLIILLILYGITHYRYIEKQKEKDYEDLGLGKTIVKKTRPLLLDASIKSSPEDVYKPPPHLTQSSEPKMGIGLFFPLFIENPTLYIYGDVNLEKSIMEHTAIDSVVFAKDQYHNPTTSYAPPWLYPEHLKLDYGIIAFKVLALGHDFVKIEANKQNNQITYLDKNQGTFIPWSQFLLTVNSVEFKEKSNQKVFVKPLDYAGEVHITFEYMQVLLVEGDWMYVRLVNDDLKEKGKGWVRWIKDNTLLIKYSFLS
ncbi:MAG: hypothetical protein WAT79_16790 [Saprospiraceae bacterium]